MNFLTKLFKLDTIGTKVSTEVVAGMTTFLTMAYIIALNPIILSDAGMDKGGVFIATILISAISCILMGLYANWPVALAPGMGLNAFFAYAVVLSMGFTWQQALFAVFVSGVVFLLISCTPVRTKIIHAIPDNLKVGIGVGVGFFLAFIGLQNAGIVTSSEVTVSTLANLGTPTVLLSCIGFLLIVFLEAMRVKGSLLISILVITIASFFWGDNAYQGVIGKLPEFTTFLALDFNVSALLNVTFITVVISMLFVDFFDSTGTLIAIANIVNHDSQGDKEGALTLDLSKTNKPLIVDSVATIIGSMLGTSTATSYIESVTGVKQGGKSGLTACVTGILFLLSLFFFPLVNSIPSYATAPALIYVGFLFIQNFKALDFDNIFELVPAGVAALIMPFSFSISHGIIFGFISHIVIQIGLGKIKDISFILWITTLLGVVFLIIN